MFVDFLRLHAHIRPLACAAVPVYAVVVVVVGVAVVFVVLYSSLYMFINGVNLIY